MSPDMVKLLALHELDAEILQYEEKQIDIQVEALKKSRQAISNTIEEALLGIYERIKSRNHVALAEVGSNCCRECHMVIRYQVLKRVREGKHITLCESCGRILYYKPAALMEEKKKLSFAQK